MLSLTGRIVMRAAAAETAQATSAKSHIAMMTLARPWTTEATGVRWTSSRMWKASLTHTVLTSITFTPSLRSARCSPASAAVVPPAGRRNLMPQARQTPRPTGWTLRERVHEAGTPASSAGVCRVLPTNPMRPTAESSWQARWSGHFSITTGRAKAGPASHLPSANLILPAL